MKRILLFSTLFFGAVHIGFAGELGKPDGSPVRLGDSVDVVKQALGTDMNPELDEETGILPATLLRPRTSSIQLKTKHEGTGSSLAKSHPFHSRENCPLLLHA